MIDRTANKCNGRYVYIPGACPTCGVEDTMFITRLTKDNKVDIKTWYFRCNECKSTKLYDWWILWSYIKDIEAKAPQN